MQYPNEHTIARSAQQCRTRCATTRSTPRHRLQPRRREKMKLLWHRRLCRRGRKPRCCQGALSDSAHLTSLLKPLLFTGMAPTRKHFWKPVLSLEFHPNTQPCFGLTGCLNISLTLLLKTEKPQAEPFTHFSCTNPNF